MKFFQQILLPFGIWLLPFSQAIVFAQSYYFEQYSVVDGLPQSQVYAIHQDSKGYLWIGTYGGGLARYNGIGFTNYAELQGLSGNYIQSITEGKNGDIWIGTNKGISRFDGQDFHSIYTPDQKPVIVYDLAIDQSGTIWAATGQGPYYVDGDSLLLRSPMAQAIKGRLYAASLDQEGQLWMGGETGLYKWLANEKKWILDWQNKGEVLDLSLQKDGTLWAAIFGYGLLKQTNDSWQKINIPPFANNQLETIWPAPDGRLWIGTQEYGVFILESGADQNNHSAPFSIASLSEADGLCDNGVKIITNDRWGNVWIGTSGGGLCKYGGQEFKHYTAADGLIGQHIYSLEQDSSGGMWVSAEDKGISFFDGNNFSHFGQDSGFADVKCRSIHQSASGQLWIGTDGEGLGTFYFTKDSIPKRIFKTLKTNDGLKSDFIKDITSNAPGEVWIASVRGGISKVSYTDSLTGAFQIKNFGQREGLDAATVQSLLFDDWGRLWFGTKGRGIGHLFKGQVQMLEPSSNANNISVRCLAADGKGFLWCGTEDRGIGRARIYGETPPVFTFFDEKDALRPSSNNIYLLQFDELGYLWAGSNRGVDRMTLDASGNILEIQHYGYAEGFRGIETCQQASLVDEQGSLWFGTMNGLMKYRPLEDTAQIIKPTIHFTEVNLFYESLADTEYGHYYDKDTGIKKNAIFPYNKNHLGFSFFANNFPNPERVTYTWQLLGMEESWSPFTNRNEVSYSNLPPGEYTFRVRAKNEQDIVGDAIATSFTIEPPFWETWLFRFSAIAILVFLIGLLFWYRIRQVRKKAAQEKAQLEMENHLLQLEQKARQLQMNPHFIFNALNSIQSLVSRKDFDGSRSYILKFGKLMRAVLDNSRQATIPLEKEIDTLKKYLEMEQFCRDDKFEFTIETSQINNDDLMIPPMLLQPFIENAILHGVAPLKDRKGLITIKMEEYAARLKISIVDNGVGLNKSPEIGVEKKRSSAGIAVTKERIRILNGKMSIEPGAQHGTVVEVFIPI